MGWLFVPGLEDWSSGFALCSDPLTEPWVTSSGKPTQQPLSWHGWTRRRWIERLSGTISNPSTAARIAAEFISSLPGIHVSRSASQGSAEGRPIRGISGLMSPESSASPSPPSSGSRTSAIICGSGSEKSEPSYEEWATTLRRDFSARQKSARRTRGRGSSYSQGAYPTPAATAYGSSQNGVNASRPSGGTPSLETWEKDWPTPTAEDVRASGDAGPNRNPGETLTDAAVRKWPTPQAHDTVERGNVMADHHHRDHDLSNAANNWPTPKTPTGGPETRASKAKRGAGGADLETPAQLWATPTTRDNKDSAGQTCPINSLLGRQVLRREENARCGRPVQMSAPLGPQSSHKSRKLNPLFDEWLMGWPIGHTCACPRSATGTAPTDSEGAGTASFRSWLRTHSRALRALLRE